MHDIRGNDQIIASLLDSLSRQWLLYIKDLIGQIGIRCCIPLLPIAQNGFRDIAEAVLCNTCLVWLSHLQDSLCGSSCTSTDLEDAYTCMSIMDKPLLQIGDNQRSEGLVEIVRDRIVLIDPL